MRKITFLLLAAISLHVQVFSQKRSYIQDPTLGVSFTLFDFRTAQYIEATSLRQTFRDKQFFRLKEMKPGLALSYTEGLSNHFDATAMVAGAFLDYPMENRQPFGTDYFLLEGDASIRAKLLSNRYIFTPYAQVGIGASSYAGYFGAFIPMGAGIQVNLFDEAFILLNSQYRIPVVNSTTTAHFFNSFGIAGKIGSRKKQKEITVMPMPQIQPPPDRDGDGVVDSVDACPDAKGLASLKGCPDADGDGIADSEDKCPNEKGLARYQGCPIPDTDGDGVNDEEDKCLNEKGVARYQGCPVPDKDKDGVNDEEDKCPDLPGVRVNNGCPEIKEEVRKRVDVASKNIFFATGSYKLLTKSNAALNDLVKLLNEDPNLKIDIEGHTDNVGKPESNQLLSERRAGSVLTYLKNKGVDESRLVSNGFGQDQPIADNETAAGKAKNRRVEMKLHY